MLLYFFCIKMLHVDSISKIRDKVNVILLFLSCTATKRNEEDWALFSGQLTCLDAR